MSSSRFGNDISRSDLLGGCVWSCVDGRSTEAVVGTPGGTLGELVLIASALENVLGRKLTQACVDQLLAGMISDGGDFYHHTDIHSLTALANTLKLDCNNESPGEYTWRWLRSPEPNLREHLLDLLGLPQHIGCGHVAAMVSEPEAYGTRSELVLYSLRAFFVRLWSGCSSVRYVALEGEHTEKEVFQINGDNDRVRPAYTSRVDGQAFIYHRDDVAWFRRILSGFTGRWLGCSLEPTDLEVELNRLGERQLGATLTRLASGLPIIEEHHE